MIRWALRSAIGGLGREGSDDRQISETIGASPRAVSMVPRITGLLAAAALIGGFGFAAPAAAYDPVQPAVPVYTLSPGRIGAIAATVMGLVGAVIGGRALARAASRIGTGTARRGAIVALVLGPIGSIGGGVIVATAGGGLGTGNGLGGGVVAMVVGLVGMTLGGLALARSRRTI